MSRTREEAIRLGIKTRETIHSKKRRAHWKKYWKKGIYGVTIHIWTDENGNHDKHSILSHVEGSCKSMPTSGSFPHCVLTDVGRIVEKRLMEIGHHSCEEGVSVKEYVIMPTHIHAIIEVANDLPIVMRGKHKERYHLGRIIGYMKSGCTARYRRWLDGEDIEMLLADETAPRESAGRRGGAQLSSAADEEDTCKAPLWESNYNDRILRDEQLRRNWVRYIEWNPYFWRMKMEHPTLFEHTLHLKVAGEEYSAYGCLFLLRSAERIPVMCHRLARKGMLTQEEWRRYTASREVADGLTTKVKEMKLGRYDRDWLQSRSMDSICPIPYTETEAFRKQKEALLDRAAEGAILVSPAISKGEQEIIYTALEEGAKVIKLQKNAITDREHPAHNDRIYCAKGRLLVLGPWEITDRIHKGGKLLQERSDVHQGGICQGSDAQQRTVGNEKEERTVENGKEERTVGNEREERTVESEKEQRTVGNEKVERTVGNEREERKSREMGDYDRFHNLNKMAEELCQDLNEMKVDLRGI